jgi:hypothetical protein
VTGSYATAARAILALSAEAICMHASWNPITHELVCFLLLLEKMGVHMREGSSWAP